MEQEMGLIMDKMAQYDPLIRKHSEEVSLYSMKIADRLKLNKDEQGTLETAALLHDIGKLDIPLEILNKKGKLSVDEFELVKRHTEYGKERLIEMGFDRYIADIVLYHHERMDGRGYYGLKGNEIPRMARIITVADAFSAMTSERPYSNAISIDEAIAELERKRGTQFDEKCVDALIKAVND